MWHQRRTWAICGVLTGGLPVRYPGARCRASWGMRRWEADDLARFIRIPTGSGCLRQWPRFIVIVVRGMVFSHSQLCSLVFGQPSKFSLAVVGHVGGLCMDSRGLRGRGVWVLVGVVL